MPGIRYFAASWRLRETGHDTKELSDDLRSVSSSRRRGDSSERSDTASWPAAQKHMTMSATDATGRAELAAAWRQSRGLISFAVLCSVFFNLLVLTGPLYMLQIMDRVLVSGSEETLVALSALAAFLLLCMGILDHARARAMSVVGARFQDTLDRRVFEAAAARSVLIPRDLATHAAQRDLEAVQQLFASPLMLASFDMPWAPFFIAVIFLFHPVLGWVALSGAAILILTALLNQRLTRLPQARASVAAMTSDRQADQMKDEADLVRALGMTGAAFDRWQTGRRAALTATLAAAGRVLVFASLARTFRLFLQSAILGIGAWLVLRGELGAGPMMAASILMARGLAPVETAVGHWAVACRAGDGWVRLAALLSHVPVRAVHTGLPRPAARLDVSNLTVVPPGGSAPSLRNISFSLAPGQAIGVIGPTGSGKSTLARSITGAWPPLGGEIRLGGATINQYDPDIFGTYIGYLPQRVTLFDGTIAENIARLAMPPDAGKVMDAAKRAAAHDMIVRLPDGYDTRVSGLGGRLSGGQMQRIGLARALYGNPLLIVLDEPNANLDNDGSVALNLAIRSMKERGKAVLVMAHRPAAIQECDDLLVIEHGMLRALGPRDQVLRDLARTQTGLVQGAGRGGA
jgi:ATP-binding cassette, subfamily C, bacterial